MPIKQLTITDLRRLIAKEYGIADVSIEKIEVASPSYGIQQVPTEIKMGAGSVLTIYYKF
jgi:hypothetical protein